MASNVDAKDKKVMNQFLQVCEKIRSDPLHADGNNCFTHPMLIFVEIELYKDEETEFTLEE
jgi:hypothetical protein